MIPDTAVVNVLEHNPLLPLVTSTTITVKNRSHAHTTDIPMSERMEEELSINPPFSVFFVFFLFEGEISEK